jgi:hypothetical protein
MEEGGGVEYLKNAKNFWASPKKYIYKNSLITEKIYIYIFSV